MAEKREFDIVVFGATGFTGEQVARELFRLNTTLRDNVKRWAVAGRSQQKLTQLVTSLTPDTSKQPPILIADVGTPASLKTMCRRARLVLNCVGPFRLYGDPVVAACVDSGTDYSDISGEPFFLESIAERYHAQAEQSGSLVVAACGMDCIPAELGVIHNAAQFPAPGFASSIEMFHTARSGPGGGAMLHYGTYESAIHGIKGTQELNQLRRRNPKPAVKYGGPRARMRGPVFYEPLVGGYCVPFPGADASVVRRTQQSTSASVPVQFQGYMKVGNLLSVLMLTLWALVVGVVVKIPKIGTRLLLKFPRLFTFGKASHEGPTPEKRAGTVLTTFLRGRGYSPEKGPAALLARNDGSRAPATDREVVTQFVCADPGYVGTAQMMLAAALTMLDDRELCPRGGVVTTGIAFQHTPKIFDRLSTHFGLRFTKVSERNVD